MPISLSRYVNITSGIGAGANVNTRNLGALVITNNALAPTGTVLSFTTAAQVLTYFGANSEEYARAVFYFGWISKEITTANQLNFLFWNNNVATGSLVFGVPATYSLATFTAISTGALNLTLGGFTHTLTGITFVGNASLTAVATTLQTAIRAYSAGGAAWTAATVTYDPVRGCFDLASGTTGVDVVSVAVAGSGTDLAAPLGWLASAGAIYSNGTAAQTITTALTNLVAINNNFGSFCFSYGLAPTLATIQAAATWNNSTTPNMLFMFSVAVSAGNASAWSAALLSTGGCTATLYPGTADSMGAYHEMMPMMIMASTNYNNRNAVQNYMFNQFNAVTLVNDDADANTYDALLINYYGLTQTAGQLLAFYQRGVMFGTSTNPSDQNVYANEVWFKDYIGAQVMTLLLAETEIPANLTGKSMIYGAVQGAINLALFNGTIETGKQLTVAQQLYITQATGSPNAWQQVQSAGYWLGVTIQSYVANSVTQYKAVYTLIYSKNDVIRLVQGQDILI